MATLSLCIGRVARLRVEFALRVLSERTLASSLTGTVAYSGCPCREHYVSGCIRIPDIADRSLWTENRSYDKIIRQFIRSYDINPF